MSVKEFYATTDNNTGHGLLIHHRSGALLGRFADLDEAETVATCYNAGEPFPGWIRFIDEDGAPVGGD